MKKVSISTVARVCEVDPSLAFSDRVEIRLDDGRIIESGEIRFACGNAKMPLTESDIRTKFLDCLSEVQQVNAGALYEQLSRLENVRDLRTLAGSALA
jgi:hypothetical protein